jgi:DNA adenine methylase
MHLTSVRAHRGTVHTPLRYPGGKTRLAGFLRRVIESGNWGNRDFVEPYAGGAGVALALLHANVVPRIIINDLDPRIHAFWTSVTQHGAEFLARFDATHVGLDEWQRQRDLYRHADPLDTVTLGFATFFLNRTNRSGIMNAGVIGGQGQAGRYKLDARYNRTELRAKLEWIVLNAGRIVVSNRDGAELLDECLSSQGVFAYIDPPYFDKGSFLYMNGFVAQSHAALAQILWKNRRGPWVLTYDNAPDIRKLYMGLYQGTFSLPYSAHKASLAKERMVLSDLVSDLDWVMT